MFFTLVFKLDFFLKKLKKKRKEKMIATMLVRLDQIVGNQNNDDAKSSQYQGKQSSPHPPQTASSP